MTHKICLSLTLGILSISPLCLEGFYSDENPNEENPAYKDKISKKSNRTYELPSENEKEENIIKPKSEKEMVLESDIRGYLDKNYPRNDFQFNLKDGVLTITGHVTSEEKRKAIETKLKDFEGVEEVENNLEFGF